MFEYESIFAQYRPNQVGKYICYDNLTGQVLGDVVLHEGPGWIFSAREMFFMWSELKSITNLIEDLNSALEE